MRDAHRISHHGKIRVTIFQYRGSVSYPLRFSLLLSSTSYCFTSTYLLSLIFSFSLSLFPSLFLSFLPHLSFTLLSIFDDIRKKVDRVITRELPQFRCIFLGKTYFLPTEESRWGKVRACRQDNMNHVVLFISQIYRIYRRSRHFEATKV